MIDLKDCTLIIPVRFDGPDRTRNVDIVLNYVKEYCDTNFLICEHDSEQRIPPEFLDIPNVRHVFMPTQDELFYKTLCINESVKKIDTEYFAVYDTDVIMPTHQYSLTIEALRSGADIVYPYDGTFLNVPVYNISKIRRDLDVSFVNNSYCRPGYGMPELGTNGGSVGGCVFFNKKSFIAGGMMNQNMVSYGPEDAEVFWRFRALGYKLHRVDGPLYHLTHERGLNSGESHSLAEQNHLEFKKVMAMNAADLRAYVETWSWNK
jgi:hypothetical protein